MERAKVFIVLSLAVILMIAPVFSGEYEGVHNIILASRYGKTKCAAAKAAASILAAVSAAALTAAFHIAIAFVLYGKSGLDCSILFGPREYAEGFLSFNLTCGTLLKYQVVLAFILTITKTCQAIRLTSERSLGHCGRFHRS